MNPCKQFNKTKTRIQYYQSLELEGSLLITMEVWAPSLVTTIESPWPCFDLTCSVS